MLPTIDDVFPRDAQLPVPLHAYLQSDPVSNALKDAQERDPFYAIISRNRVCATHFRSASRDCAPCILSNRACHMVLLNAQCRRGGMDHLHGECGPVAGMDHVHRECGPGAALCCSVVRVCHYRWSALTIYGLTYAVQRYT